MARRAQNYQESNWFLVPLRDIGYAVGLIARMERGRGGKSILGYFFGPGRAEPPELQELQTLTADDAILVCIFGDLSLHRGDWRVIGSLENWDRDAWPMPHFARTDVVSGETILVRYADDDPGKWLEHIPCDPSEAALFPTDGLSGAGAVEIKLTSFLGDK